MGKVTPHPIDGGEIFEPKEITEWLLKQTIYIPPKPLLSLLEIDETKENEKDRALENAKASEAQARAERKYDFDAMTKNNREQVVLDYAVEVWQKEKSPRIGFVHQKIKENPKFIFGKTRPTTVCKPITESRIVKEIAVRKNAANRAENTF